jgi:glycosyltransferase involved in cell wall biosynthesis
MKVCIVNQLGRAQGPDHTDAIIADCLIKNGFEVSIATNCKFDVVKHFHDNFDVFLPPDTPVYGMLPSSLHSYPVFGPTWVWLSLRQALRKEKPDIVLCDGVPYNVNARRDRKPTLAVYFSEPISGELARAHGSFGRKPFHAKIYSIIYFKILELLSTKDVDILIANSKAGATHYEQIFNRKVHVLPSPVDTSKFLPGRKENLVTHVGILNPRKKIESVIEAVAKARTCPRLSIIGNINPGLEGYAEFLRSLVKRLNIENRVSFHVNASFDELRDIVARSKIFVSAGVEYFSLAVIEQMSAGSIPIVSRHFVPWSEIVEYGKFGFGFESIDEIADTIDNILMDPELASRMQNLAMRRAEEFDVRIFCRRLVNILMKGSHDR